MRPSSCRLTLQRLREVPALLSAVREEFVERRVEQPDRDREPVHRLEDRLEVRPLHRQQLGERAAPAGVIAGHDHLAHGGDPVALEEHVLGAAEPDPLRAERSRDAASRGVSALARTRSRRTASAHSSTLAKA